MRYRGSQILSCGRVTSAAPVNLHLSALSNEVVRNVWFKLLGVFSLNNATHTSSSYLSLLRHTHKQKLQFYKLLGFSLSCLTAQLASLHSRHLYCTWKPNKHNLCCFLAGSDQSEACWSVLWWMRRCQGKLPVRGHGAVPRGHVERYRLWVLHLQPGSGPVPEGRVQSCWMPPGEPER